MSESVDDFNHDSDELGPAWTTSYRGIGMGVTATDGQRVPWVNAPTPSSVCPNCRKPFETGDVLHADLKPGMSGVFQHRDCDDPTLAKGESWVDQVHDAVGDWEGP